MVWGVKEEYKSVGLHGCYYKLFEEEEVGGVQESIDGYPYLKHLVKLWTGYREEHLGNINENISEVN